MSSVKQNSSQLGRNYFFVVAPLLMMAALCFQSQANAMAMGPYNDLSEPVQHGQAGKKDQTSDDGAGSKPIADKNINPGDDVDTRSFVREALPLWERKSLNKKSWSEHVYKTLKTHGSALLSTNPSDAKTFCPNYRNLNESQRIQFWTFFISSMAKFESNFNPDDAYTEKFKDNTRNYVVSRGLLQISIESSKDYRCGFTSGQQLHNPERNLTCGIIILNHWMLRDQRIASNVGGKWKGGARYWSVLRKAPKQSYTSIVKWNSELPFCRE